MIFSDDVERMMDELDMPPDPRFQLPYIDLIRGEKMAQNFLANELQQLAMLQEQKQELIFTETITMLQQKHITLPNNIML